MIFAPTVRDAPGFAASLSPSTDPACSPSTKRQVTPARISTTAPHAPSISDAPSLVFADALNLTV
ncbi:MAG: hypothetical protein BGP09_02245 [Rhizobium sp. 60-20]|nr:MAG: hypothetical protein BGP09_02245 [Rhizobium sp. 60-20]